MTIRVFIDQGHNLGEINAGANGNGVVEAEVTYRVGKYLAKYLNTDPAFTARVSRLFPDTVLGYDAASSLQERVAMANRWPADYFISIHVNANLNPNINGSEIYVYQENSVAYDLAQVVLASIVTSIPMRDNQVRINPRLYVLRKTTMPAILIELGYLSNPEDAQKLLTKQEQFAYAIYQGLRDYVMRNA
ncbi:N-acetylmuramoyl-L-alanine amidase family protein [Amedibacillus dolichus]|uniref:N-acetylmuramoyl-L-alanine amidase n=1 Tax=Amedibacillus dolichus DSM 3991 TaxID=428127 RepID=A8RE39_9FIRM|nr:N-acetylmuramoyl-L-alanine amidase [Amedibacillus dolichus]EDP10437.1 N-acetylmuramoyl-L-alanine amidase [Amedibacillus dolichus DSM 3991]MCG4880504.1 N-acetylmuramoyl-L-alanine amidase [Amedibacillus dolichus]